VARKFRRSGKRAAGQANRRNRMHRSSTHAARVARPTRQIGLSSVVNVSFTVQVWKEGDQFIAHAMPLDVASSGATPDAAREAVDEAARCFLLAADDAGTLDQVLDECGRV
jgi:hypothetical protein